MGRGDVAAGSGKAEKLIEEYGSVGALLEECRRRTALDGPLDAAAFRELSWFDDAMTCVLRDDLLDRPLIDGAEQLARYLRSQMAHSTTEQFRIFYLDVANRLIRDEVATTGTIDTATLYPRAVIARALELGAAALIIAHNHPSGDPRPSDSDVASTQALAALCRGMEITLHDHVIVGRGGIASLRASGLLPA